MRPDQLVGYLPVSIVETLTDHSISDLIRAAYRQGYQDHAKAAQHWRDTHGAYRAPACPWCSPGGES